MFEYIRIVLFQPAEYKTSIIRIFKKLQYVIQHYCEVVYCARTGGFFKGCPDKFILNSNSASFAIFATPTSDFNPLAVVQPRIREMQNENVNKYLNHVRARIFEYITTNFTRSFVWFSIPTFKRTLFHTINAPVISGGSRGIIGVMTLLSSIKISYKY